MNKQPTAPAGAREVTSTDQPQRTAPEVTVEEMAFFEEAMALASPTPEDEAAFADHLRKHGGGTGDK